MSSYVPNRPGEYLGFSRLTPFRVTVIYVAFGGVFLFVSDVLFVILIADSALLARVQGLKGAVEVFLTGGIIYVLSARMQRQYQQSERRYHNLTTSSPAPIILFDGEGEIVWGNDAARELLGAEENETLVGQPFSAFVHPDDHDLSERVRFSVIERSEAVGPAQMRLRGEGREVRYTRVSAAPGWFQGEWVGQAVVVDVTELRNVEEALRSERDFIRNALDELSDVFYVFDHAGGLRRWNTRLTEVTGYTDEELAGMDAAELFLPREEPPGDESVVATLERGDGFVEADLATRDGKRRQYEFKGSRLTEDDGTEQVVGIGRDITDRTRMERELRENEQRYRTLVEMSPYSILVHSDGQVVYANDAFVSLVHGNAQEALTGTSLTEFFHPADREDVVRTAVQTQRGEQLPTDRRYRIVTLDGRERHVEITARPIAYEDEPAVLTVVNDVTHQRRYEEMLTGLHERTREMIHATDGERIAEIGVDTTDELLDTASVVYEFDDSDRLVPLDWSDDLDGEGIQAVTRGDGPLWEAFVDGEGRLVDLEGTGLRPGPGAGSPTSAMVLPLSNHGLLVTVADREDSFTTTRREVLNLVRENTNAAFDRAEQERSLRERDRRLERQNQALEQLNRLNAVIREINQTLVRSATRSEIMESVCERISAGDQYSFAWVGARASGDDPVEPQYWSGTDPEYVDHIRSMDAQTPLSRLIAAALREGAVQVAPDVLDDPEWDDHRSEILNYGYRSVAVVPIVRGDSVDDVLVIYADDADIFDEREQTVLAELGETMGYALRNVDRAEAIQSDERTEVELAVHDGRLLTNRITADSDAHVEFVGAVTAEADSLRLFLRFDGVTETEVKRRLEPLEQVTAVQPLSVEDERGLYQLTVSTPPLIRILQRNGVRLRALTADDGTTTLVGVLRGSVSVRTVVDEIQSAYPETELLARRRNTDPIETRETFRDRILDDLTERQQEALRTAFYSGFYEWPRETNSAALAEMMGVASSTYQYHLRAAEQTVVRSVLESGELPGPLAG